MRVFRPTRKADNGKQQNYEKWYVEFRDHHEKIRRLPGFTDKVQTGELGRKVEKLVAARANDEAPDKDMRKWLESLPARMRNALAKIGLVDALRVAAVKPLADHLDDFERSLVAKGGTAKHATLVAQRARRLLIEDCGFRKWSDISASKVEGHLAQLRAGEPDKDNGLSVQTSNFYLQAVKQFARWMIADGRASETPLAHLQTMNVQTDRRHDRRALTVDELRWLLTTTGRGPERCGIAGSERAIVYRLAVETGLRANEIRTLKRASFDFASVPATVTVEAGYSKRRRKDVLPMRPDTSRAVQSHLACKLPEAPAFAMPQADHNSRVMRADLQAARDAWLEAAQTPQERREREGSMFLTYRDDAGLVADFHALRHTFISNLANSGVHPKVAQTLARHSTITLTMDRYTHSKWEDMGEAIDRLPALNALPNEARATGTDDARVAFCVAQSDADASNSVHRRAVNTRQANTTPETLKGARSKQNTANSPTIQLADGEGFELTPISPRKRTIPSKAVRKPVHFLRVSSSTSICCVSFRHGRA